MNIAIGRGGFQISLLVNTREQKTTIQLYMPEDADKIFFDALLSHKDEAEATLGVKLDWRRLEGKKASSIDYSQGFKVTDPDKQEEIFAWYKEYTEKFISFFKPIIKKL
jgi:hypothetical protein